MDRVWGGEYSFCLLWLSQDFRLKMWGVRLPG